MRTWSPAWPWHPMAVSPLRAARTSRFGSGGFPDDFEARGPPHPFPRGCDSIQGSGGIMTPPNTILVTGGASGIGFAVVQAVVARGWRVVVADVDPSNLEQARVRLSLE